MSDNSSQPIAYRMRPKKIEDVVGQQHLIGEGKIINRMVEAKNLNSMILYGQPGIGKTSIASAIAGSTEHSFRMLNAATDGKKELTAIVEEAKFSGTIVLLLDEIHRLDKVKQDFLLPYLESGQIIVIGATTENPYINVTPAIRSRMQIFELQPLTPDDIQKAIDRALADPDDGLGNFNVEIDDKAKQHLTQSVNGDLRTALNALEIAVKSTKAKGRDKKIKIDLSIIEEVLGKKAISGDKDGDAHYDVISAFQKSIRGSDTDAALHYLARILETGDLMIAVRRLLVIAYEDIGLANPSAAARTTQAVNAALQLGLPEARIPLANAVIDLALSPKSNSAYMAINQAIEDVQSGTNFQVPRQLKNTANWGKSQDDPTRVEYLYPHDYPNDWVKQEYLPKQLKKAIYFQPKGNSAYEQKLAETYQNLKRKQK